jgi:hypothetical protein
MTIKVSTLLSHDTVLQDDSSPTLGGPLDTNNYPIENGPNPVTITGNEYPISTGLTGQVLATNGFGVLYWTSAGSGSVTSVGAASTGPNSTALTLGGTNPVTSSGIINFTLNTFGTANPGVVPESPGGTTDFLRADGTWAVPPGGGGGNANNITGGAANEILYQTAPNTTSFIAAPTLTGTYLEWNGTNFVWGTVSGSGTVTSVGLSSIGAYSTSLTIGSSPVTTAGTITITPNIFSSGTPGVVPTSPGGTTEFLRADGTWAIPPGSSGVTSFSAGTTGFTPNTATTGAITLVGSLNISNGGTGQTTSTAAFNALSPMTTTGDLIYESGTNTASRLAIGTTGQVLTVVAGKPAWETLASSAVTSFQTSLSGLTPGTATTGAVTLAGTLGVTSGGTGVVTLTTDGVLYGGTTIQATPAGITGQVLVGNTGSAPSWTSSPAISGANITTGTIPNSALVNSSITVSTSGSGIGVSGSPVSLGGTVTLSNTGVTSLIAGTGISVSSATGDVTVTNIDPFSPIILTETGTYTELAVAGFKVILANAAGGPVIVNLPTSASASGLIYSTKKIDTTINTVSVTPSGTDTIDGSNTPAVIRQPYASITLVSNGIGGWFII